MEDTKEANDSDVDTELQPYEFAGGTMQLHRHIWNEFYDSTVEGNKYHRVSLRPNAHQDHDKIAIQDVSQYATDVPDITPREAFHRVFERRSFASVAARKTQFVEWLLAKVRLGVPASYLLELVIDVENKAVAGGEQGTALARMLVNVVRYYEKEWQKGVSKQTVELYKTRRLFPMVDVEEQAEEEKYAEY